VRTTISPPPLAGGKVRVGGAVCKTFVNVYVQPATLIVRARDWVAMADAASFTWTVKESVPSVVGVPEINPALDSVRPAGRLPDGSDHV
jgi:hypothetical protein